MSENPSPLKTPVRIYAIATGLLLSFLWLVARRVALDTYAFWTQVRGGSPGLPPLSRFIYFITPHAWLLPLALLLAVALLWKKDEKWTVHALGAATVACLLYLGLCAIGFVMPFLPKLSESGP